MTLLSKPTLRIGLHKPTEIYSRQETQLAYEAAFYPAVHLSSFHRIVWEQDRHWTKKEVLLNCNDELTEISLLDESEPFKIHWIYNNIPTETEWERFNPTKLFRIQFRISPVIAAGNGRIALIDHTYSGNFLAKNSYYSRQRNLKEMKA